MPRSLGKRKGTAHRPSTINVATDTVGVGLPDGPLSPSQSPTVTALPAGEPSPSGNVGVGLPDGPPELGKRGVEDAAPYSP